jgi:predicted dienelactone hydrolase
MSHLAVAPTGAPITSIRPLFVPAPDRGVDLEVRVTAPMIGAELPVIVFSHGFGETIDGYAPLAEFWAAHGLAVSSRPTSTHRRSRWLRMTVASR